MASELPEPYATGVREADVIAQEFFATLGRAIAKWQHVEFGLFSVLSIVSGCTKREIASAIFYSASDFSDKLKMTDNAARLALDKDAFEEKWRPLRNRCRDASEARNAFAHFWVMQGADTKGPQVRLWPNLYDENEKTKKRKEEFKEFDQKKIARYCVVFSRLQNDLSAFFVEIGKSEAIPSESPPPREK